VTGLGISLGWSYREPLDRVVGLVRDAEQDGVEACWVIDSQMAMRDAFALLASLATATNRILIGPGVTNLVTRHETVLANSLSTLAALAPRRILAGLGAGDSAVFPIGLQPQRIAELRTGITRLRALLAGSAVIGPVRPYSVGGSPSEAPPIYLAASQPRMLELAGAVADGVIVMGPANPQVWATQMDHISRGAIASGRNPSTIARDVWVTMAVGHDALDSVRSWASAQARWMARWKTVPEALQPFRPEMNESAEEYDFGQHLSLSASHTETVSDDLARALAVVGSPTECAERLSALAELKPDRITFALLSGGRERRLTDTLEVWKRLINNNRTVPSRSQQ
jgi:5,10-methylenetetrahydromethanopterin reductase